MWSKCTIVLSFQFYILMHFVSISCISVLLFYGQFKGKLTNEEQYKNQKSTSFTRAGSLGTKLEAHKHEICHKLAYCWSALCLFCSLANLMFSLVKLPLHYVQLSEKQLVYQCPGFIPDPNSCFLTKCFGFSQDTFDAFHGQTFMSAGVILILEPASDFKPVFQLFRAMHTRIQRYTPVVSKQISGVCHKKITSPLMNKSARLFSKSFQSTNRNPYWNRWHNKPFVLHTFTVLVLCVCGGGGCFFFGGGWGRLFVVSLFLTLFF